MDKKVFYLGGILTDEEVNYCIENSINYDMAANNFQNKFIKGFKENNINITCINVPFLSYHHLKKKNTVRIINDNNTNDEVDFYNYKYINSMFKYYALKKAIKNIDFSNSIIFSYSIHTPFLKILKHIKTNFNDVKVIQIVPDLPQYMNLTSKSKIIYSLLKKIEIFFIESLLKNVDFFVPFTRLMMDDFLQKYQKPFYVMEGVIDFKNELTNTIKEDSNNFQVVYAGSLNKKYGVGKLIKAFEYINEENIKLKLCGNGDLVDFLENNKFKNIEYLGVLSPEQTTILINNADLLINPREANEKYTRYSFPSKLFEYMSSGNKILCFKLPGIPSDYFQFMYFFESNLEKDMANEIVNTLYNKTNINLSKDFLLSKTAKCHISNILMLATDKE